MRESVFWFLFGACFGLGVGICIFVLADMRFLNRLQMLEERVNLILELKERKEN